MTTLRTVATAALAASVMASGTLGAQATVPGLEPGDQSTPTRQGTRGANFLELGVGARGNAMAGAVASSIEGPTAWYWNPAGGAGAEQLTIAATRQNLYQDLDITHDFFGLSIPLFGGVAGASVISMSSGDIPRTAEGSDPTAGDPQFGETFTWSSMAIGLSFARRLTDRLDLGASVKYVTEGISDADIGWAAVDVGTQFRTGLYGLTIGAALANVGPSSEMSGPRIRRIINTDEFVNQRTQIDLVTRETELPTMFRFSVGTDLFGRVESLLGQGDGRHSIQGELAFMDAIDTDVQLALGAEYAFRDQVFVRGGKRFYNDDRATGTQGLYGLSGGAGVRIPVSGRSLRFDYAYTSLGDLENVQVFSFEFGR